MAEEWKQTQCSQMGVLLSHSCHLHFRKAVKNESKTRDVLERCSRFRITTALTEDLIQFQHPHEALKTPLILAPKDLVPSPGILWCMNTHAHRQLKREERHYYFLSDRWILKGQCKHCKLLAQCTVLLVCSAWRWSEQHETPISVVLF